MKASTKIAALGLVVMGAMFNTGCNTLDNLHAAAIADRQANPEKYTEIPSVQMAQMTPNQDGSAYPQSCAFGCPTAEERIELTRNW
ncbi:MAG: hypothetical protein WC749_01085 [Dehalococcoidia bacterium]|uniref:hypothetical protein n=1 Tax=unclassified Pseudomonas TaxID=196821 RepID=UPI0014749FD1|nr:MULTISPECIES: hypothetical protein [unclassified Pseudomonas]NMX92471.1 hypothetical protein [Pseudomonas sp. WS 5086]NMY47251.1 hypothetical protein [Pseudomonas sp. WS 5027]